MRIGTAILFLFASLVLVSCKKKEASDTKPPACTVVIEKLDSCVHDLSRCESETGWPNDSCDQVQPSPATPPLTEGLGEGVSAEAPEEFEPKAGETYVLGQGNQTVVMNPKPVQDDVRRFVQGSVCRFDSEGKVKIVGKRVYKMDGDGEEETEYLVRYTRDPVPETLRPGDDEAADAEPYECPDGTVFYLDDVSILEEEDRDAFEAAKKLLNSEKP